MGERNVAVTSGAEEPSAVARKMTSTSGGKDDGARCAPQPLFLPQGLCKPWHPTASSIILLPWHAGLQSQAMPVAAVAAAAATTWLVPAAVTLLFLVLLQLAGHCRGGSSTATATSLLSSSPQGLFRFKWVGTAGSGRQTNEGKQLA